MGCGDDEQQREDGREYDLPAIERILQDGDKHVSMRLISVHNRFFHHFLERYSLPTRHRENRVIPGRSMCCAPGLMSKQCLQGHFFRRLTGCLIRVRLRCCCWLHRRLHCRVTAAVVPQAGVRFHRHTPPRRFHRRCCWWQLPNERLQGPGVRESFPPCW